MIIGTTLLVVGILIVGIWVFIEFKRFKHNFRSIDGIKEAGTLYFSWLGSVFGNIKSITTNAIRMDWSPDPGNGTNHTLNTPDLSGMPEIVHGQIE